MAHRTESYKIKNTRAFNSFQFNSFLHVTNLELIPAKLQQHLKVCILYDVVVRFMKIVIICNACTLMFVQLLLPILLAGRSCTSLVQVHTTYMYLRWLTNIGRCMERILRSDLTELIYM